MEQTTYLKVTGNEHAISQLITYIKSFNETTEGNNTLRYSINSIWDMESEVRDAILALRKHREDSSVKFYSKLELIKESF